MKKIIIGISFLLVGTAHVSALPCVDLKNNLVKGKETSEVLLLQNFLAEKGFLIAKPNGYFGNGTLLAVKKYQESVGLSRSGQVFPLTRAMIKKDSCTNISSTTGNTQTTSKTTVTTVTTSTTTQVVASKVLTSNERRQEDVINLLKAMYASFKDTYGAYPISYITTSPVELCTMGISLCGSTNEIKSSLVPKFLTQIPADPSVVKTSTSSGYFITRSIYGDIKITAPKADAKADIFAQCNFNNGCVVKTAKDIQVTVSKPYIDSIGRTVFLSGSSMNIPLTINGTGFASASNTVVLKLQGNTKSYTLGTFPSATGTLITATSGFTISPFSCGTNCSEIPTPGRYDVIVKNQGGESNTGVVSLQGITSTSLSNAADASFKPKNTHVKLGTVTVSSPSPVTLKTLVFTLHGSSTLVSKVTNFTLTDAMTGKVINSGPTFNLGSEVVSDYKTKIYELYADIADIDNSYAGRIEIKSSFTGTEAISGATVSVPVPKFTISISY